MAKKKKEPVDLAVNLYDKAKTVEADTVIKILQKSDYRGCPVYIRMIDGKIFEYLVVHNGEIYTGFNVITPQAGKKELSKDEIAQCGALIFTGAITTIDMLTDDTELLAKPDNKIVH